MPFLPFFGFVKVIMSVKDLELENASLKQLLSERDAEIAFLRVRLSNLRSLFEEAQSLESSVSTTQLQPVPSSAFPGIKMRSETVLEKNLPKLALGSSLGSIAPPPRPSSSAPSNDTPPKLKKQGSWFGRAKK